MSDVTIDFIITQSAPTQKALRESRSEFVSHLQLYNPCCWKIPFPVLITITDVYEESTCLSNNQLAGNTGNTLNCTYSFFMIGHPPNHASAAALWLTGYFLITQESLINARSFVRPHFWMPLSPELIHLARSSLWSKPTSPSLSFLLLLAEVKAFPYRGSLHLTKSSLSTVVWILVSPKIHVGTESSVRY